MENESVIDDDLRFGEVGEVDASFAERIKHRILEDGGGESELDVAFRVVPEDEEVAAVALHRERVCVGGVDGGYAIDDVGGEQAFGGVFDVALVDLVSKLDLRAADRALHRGQGEIAQVVASLRAGDDLDDGKVVGKIADATRGMYLRTCRVVWNECIRQGFLTEDKYPFSNKDNTLISIPRGKRRQQSYLSVDEMTELYKVFVEKRYPEGWDPAYKKRAHDSLGLFLAQYLCNGFNLADAGRLTYNRTYFAEGGRAFEFMRKKTSARSNSMSVVIVPIIEPLKVILNEIGAKPEKDAYVFPQIFNGATDETLRRKLTVQENSNIKDRMNRICKEVLGWDKVVSGTWARHSFATNLKLAGVEELYISESMGHSQGNDVTSGYQDMYPLEIRFRNNSKLLNLEKEEEPIDIDSLTPEQMKEMLKKMMGQQ